jgi:LemA protein
MNTDYNYSDYPTNSLFSPQLIIFAVIAFIIIWVAATYNRLARLKNLITESWSNVDTELRRRYDLIPNLVEAVKAYAAHEKAIFETVANARAKAISTTGKISEQSEAETQLVDALKSLLAVQEAYPDLKANQNFLHLQKELVITEDRIQAARRFYNCNVRDYNNLIMMFPSKIIASIYGHQTASFFEVQEAVREALRPVFEELHP